jgi:hypothetical protein
MRTRTITLVEFDSQEWYTLKRVEPAIRIGFPTEEVEQMALDGKDKKIINAWWARWPARKLQQVCKTRQEWDPAAIWEAWEALVDLEAVLEEQSTRDYWERTLKPSEPASVGKPVPAADLAKSYEGGAVGLIAPGTDVCGMLAETRGAQLREVREALPILEAARAHVGPKPEPRVPIKQDETL